MTCEQAAEDVLMRPHQAVLHRSKGSAQLDLGLNSGPDIDLEDQAKGRRGLVVGRNPATGERQRRVGLTQCLPE